ncbi:TIGR03862 family flavoprotein [Ruegeria sp. Ofav3-42]|uniref:TIGR03862 family flavoprotein n=1 Tax=Ruegeria sp. Ofav3-42 TaxID=2917759 RepID=UPI001EF7251A|nr:TIGR03862 family flavoprotein [Ruegeria sp. Ofav3-42]MCG7520642.1 TIGR03862 family flavoprotein [Ruegeria sp. Ofav3-42]
MAQAVVIGGGPAGLMAAEELANAGHDVVLAEAKPSIARKFLMAGKSGLNLTKDETFETLLESYGEAADWLRPVIAEFDASDVQRWARRLGQELFTGSTGRVFPTSMKASPLLRAWLARLAEAGVQVQTRWRWVGWDGTALIFDTPDSQQCIKADATVLALGGASWSRLGSDGAWAPLLQAKGVSLTPFAPANSAISVDWSPHMQPHFGAALKSVRWMAGDLESRGEAALSANGLEGGGLYSLTPALREVLPLFVDLVPDLDSDTLKSRFSSKKSKMTLSQWLKKSLHLSPQKVALFYEMVKRSGVSQSQEVSAIKRLPIVHAGLRPMDEAISTAGGVPRAALDDGLMLTAIPGVYCAGEMLDWEAPTGGYLLTACLATGRWAGRAAACWLDRAS